MRVCTLAQAASPAREHAFDLNNLTAFISGCCANANGIDDSRRHGTAIALAQALVCRHDLQQCVPAVPGATADR
jgi:hypothetical protein